MNPFTRFLRQWTKDNKLDTLIEHVDALEALIIRVYRQSEATAADEAEYQALRRWMQANYSSWQDRLQPFWKEAMVAGEPAQEDPFLRLFQAEHAAAFVDDWQTMQTLPAAREALNKLVVSQRTEN